MTAEEEPAPLAAARSILQDNQRARSARRSAPSGLGRRFPPATPRAARERATRRAGVGAPDAASRRGRTLGRRVGAAVGDVARSPWRGCSWAARGRSPTWARPRAITSSRCGSVGGWVGVPWTIGPRAALTTALETHAVGTCGVGRAPGGRVRGPTSPSSRRRPTCCATRAAETAPRGARDSRSTRPGDLLGMTRLRRRSAARWRRAPGQAGRAPRADYEEGHVCTVAAARESFVMVLRAETCAPAADRARRHQRARARARHGLGEGDLGGRQRGAGRGCAASLPPPGWCACTRGTSATEFPTTCRWRSPRPTT